MEFTFTSPFSSPSGTSKAHDTGGAGASGTMASQQQQQQQNEYHNQSTMLHQPTPSTTSTTAPPIAFNFPSLSTLDPNGVNPDNPYDRISVKKSRGVGSTRQWRDRLITQVEDKIKQTRASIQNSRRAGLSLTRTTSIAGQSEPSSSQEFQSSSQGNESFDQSSAGTEAQPQLTDEEHMRLVAEVWETFKRENFEELARDLEGMTDQDITDMEQEILKYNYTTEYDPTYDTMMDMEEQHMDDTIERYMRMDESQQVANGGNIQDEAALMLSFAMTLLSRGPCIRCQSAPLQFEATSSSPSPSTLPRALCGQCGLCLERDMLLYVGGSAKNHSLGCAGQLQFANDEDTGLLMLCSQCDFLA